MIPDEVEKQADADWQGYYKWLEGREPRLLLVVALARFNFESDASSQRHAVDLGCGDGTETLTLLAADWSVLAIDSEPAAVEYLLSRGPEEFKSRLETRTSPFERLDLPTVDLVYAGNSLPFCKPDSFASLWLKISSCIRPGGRFAGQMFGVRDSWTNNPEMTFHTAAEVSVLFSNGFEIETLDEIDEDGNACSDPKHWHVSMLMLKNIHSHFRSKAGIVPVRCSSNISPNSAGCC